MGHFTSLLLSDIIISRKGGNMSSMILELGPVITKDKSVENKEAIAICKEWVLLKETEKETKKALETLEPVIEELRNQDEKKTKFAGSFRNKSGEFVINHIEVDGQDKIALSTAQEALESGIITPAAYAFLVKRSDPYSYNTCRFEVGVSK